MSISYRVEVELEAQFNEEAIKKILGRGAKGMFVYYKDIENLNNPITFGEAAFLIANGCADYLGLRYRLLCSFRETFFDLAFYPDDHLVFGLVPALSIWEKEFTNYYFGVDIASYIEIMLMICKDFKINKLELGSF